jgi:hypothetical protein
MYKLSAASVSQITRVSMFSYCCLTVPQLRRLVAGLLTAAAWVGSQVRSCGICGGQSATGVGFLRVLLLSPATSHFTNSSILICHLGLVQQPN